MKSSPLREGYLVKNSYLYFFLKCIDFFFRFFYKPNNNPIYTKPQKILLSNIAHLGDVFIATSVVPVLKSAFPDCKIGFVCGHWAQDIVRNNPMIDRMHFVDHWKLNRSDISLFKKVLHYFKTKRQAVKDIKQEKYDIAIDLYYYFPNSIYFFYKANIPNRIAYSSGGFKPFLTHFLDWKNENKHVSLYHLELLKFLSIDQKHYSKQKSVICEKILPKNKIQKDYVIFHIGAGDADKEWSLDKWEKLKNTMLSRGYKVLFTGKGQKENEKINQIIQNDKNCVNLCDKLDYLNLVSVIKNTKIVICVDSLVSHIASSLNIPTVVIFSGVNNIYHWVLSKSHVQVVSYKLACSFCYQKKCLNMLCMKNITVQKVLEKIHFLL